MISKNFEICYSLLSIGLLWRVFYISPFVLIFQLTLSDTEHIDKSNEDKRKRKKMAGL